MNSKLPELSSPKGEKSKKPPDRDHEPTFRMSSNHTPEVCRKSCSWKKKNKVCAAVFLFFGVSIVLHIIKSGNPSNLQKIKRTRRQTVDFRKNQNDIEIIPENRKNHHHDHHPNHRYEEENYKKTTNRLKSRRGWSARHPNNIQDIILNGKLEGPRPEGEFPNDLSKGSGPRVRLKGVYVHPGSEEGLFGSQWDDTFYDSKEINNLMRNDSGTVGKRPVKRGFKSPGAPFTLPGRGAEGPRHTPKTRPITIYLDFYPMNEFRGRKPELNFITPSNKLRNPLANEFLPPQGSPNGIIMKLNLYPKESTTSEWNSDRRTPHSKYNKRAEKKSFGWFSKHEKKKKKDQPKECSITGLNPRGKRITAKWKNERGEWIHADHVDIKYLKKEND